MPRAGSVWVESVCRVPKPPSVSIVWRMRSGSMSRRMPRSVASAFCGRFRRPGPSGHWSGRTPAASAPEALTAASAASGVRAPPARAPAAIVPVVRRVRRVAPWVGADGGCSGFFPRWLDILPCVVPLARNDQGYGHEWVVGLGSACRAGHARTDLDGALAPAEHLAHLDQVVEVRGLDHVEAGQLLGRLGVRTLG